MKAEIKLQIRVSEVNLINILVCILNRREVICLPQTIKTYLMNMTQC